MEGATFHSFAGEKQKAEDGLKPSSAFLVEEGGFEPPKAVPTDLQSAPFGHSGTPPYMNHIKMLVVGAGERNRTINLLITNQLLCRLSYTSKSSGFSIARFWRNVKSLSEKKCPHGENFIDSIKENETVFPTVCLWTIGAADSTSQARASPAACGRTAVLTTYDCLLHRNQRVQ